MVEANITRISQIGIIRILPDIILWSADNTSVDLFEINVTCLKSMCCFYRLTHCAFSKTRTSHFCKLFIQNLMGTRVEH